MQAGFKGSNLIPELSNGFIATHRPVLKKAVNCSWSQMQMLSREEAIGVGQCSRNFQNGFRNDHQCYFSVRHFPDRIEEIAVG